MNDGNEAELFARLQPRDRKAFFSRLSSLEQQDFLYRWQFWARREQRPPEGDWSVWMIMAGRGFGKTRAGAEWVRNIAEGDGSARFALVGANYAETRTVMVEGESGLLSIAPPQQRPVWEPSLKRLTWDNGAQAHLYSAAEPEGLRGPQHSHGWCDKRTRNCSTTKPLRESTYCFFRPFWRSKPIRQLSRPLPASHGLSVRAPQANGSIRTTKSPAGRAVAGCSYRRCR